MDVKALEIFYVNLIDYVSFRTVVFHTQSCRSLKKPGKRWIELLNNMLLFFFFCLLYEKAREEKELSQVIGMTLE